MEAVSSDQIAVSTANLPPPVVQQAPSEANSRQNSSPPVASSSSQDFAVSISHEAREAAAKAGAVADQKASVSASMEKEKRTDSAARADELHARKANERAKFWEEAGAKIEQQKAEEREAEDKLKLEEEAAKVAERRKKDQEKADSAEQEKQREKGNILDAVRENSHRANLNRQRINAAIKGNPLKQSDESENVMSAATADSPTIFIQRGSSQRRPPLDTVA